MNAFSECSGLHGNCCTLLVILSENAQRFYSTSKVQQFVMQPNYIQKRNTLRVFLSDLSDETTRQPARSRTRNVSILFPPRTKEQLICRNVKERWATKLCILLVYNHPLLKVSMTEEDQNANKFYPLLCVSKFLTSDRSVEVNHRVQLYIKPVPY